MLLEQPLSGKSFALINSLKFTKIYFPLVQNSHTVFGSKYFDILFVFFFIWATVFPSIPLNEIVSDSVNVFTQHDSNASPPPFCRAPTSNRGKQ